MTQILISMVKNQGEANEKLRLFSQLYPKRKIINVQMNQTENPPLGWFMVITYEI